MVSIKCPLPSQSPFPLPTVGASPSSLRVMSDTLILTNGTMHQPPQSCLRGNQHWLVAGTIDGEPEGTKHGNGEMAKSKNPPGKQRQNGDGIVHVGVDGPKVPKICLHDELVRGECFEECDGHLQHFGHQIHGNDGHQCAGGRPEILLLGLLFRRAGTLKMVWD